MSYPSPHHAPEENLIDLRSSEISELCHQSILPLCNQVQRLTNQMEQWVSSPTKSVKMETGVSQSEQRCEPMHKEDSVDIFPQVVAHEMKLRTFSGTPDNSDQINVGEWIAEAKRNIRLLGYKGRGSVNYILKFLTGPAQERVEKLAWSDSCDSEGVLAVLKDTYGENLTLGELHFRLYQRTQGVLENVWTYSHALETLHEEIVNVAPTQVVSRSDTLKEVFLKGLRDQGMQSGLRWYLRGQPGMSYEELVQVAAEESKKTTKQTIKEKNPSKGVVTAINECSPMVKEVRETLNSHGSVPHESGVEKMLAELRVDIQAVKTDLVQIKGESAIYVDSGGTGRPPVGTGTKVEVEEVHQGGPLSSQEMESRPRECRKLLENREMANPCFGKPTSRGRTTANGGSIPYLGYMLMDVEILEYKIEQVGVLVRKGEQSSASQAPGLIEMNVLRQCREVLVKDFGPQYVDCSIIKGNRFFSKCFQEIESIHRWQQKDHVGFASSTRWKPTRIPANCRQAVSIYIRSLRRCPKLEVLIEPMQAGVGWLPPKLLLIPSYTTIRYGKGVATVANVGNSCMWLKRNWHVGVARGADLCPQQETAEVIHRMHLRAAPRVADGSDGTDTYDGDDEDDAGCPVGDPRPDSGESSRHEVDTQGSNEDLDPVTDSSSSSSEEESQVGLAVRRNIHPGVSRQQQPLPCVMLVGCVYYLLFNSYDCVLQICEYDNS
ncbi:putative PNMA-containing protein [Homarus americanus]|uniref:Putative PNMA-containing protein n=1 Tax=Homarus americanus TaxID=6706 RepID=A0A8J5MN23_HOMAM|nr:putative PNMA-containing protein [Homarus americanus]